MTWIVIVSSIAALIGAAAIVYGIAALPDRTTHEQPRHRRTPTRQARPHTSPSRARQSTSTARRRQVGLSSPDLSPTTQAYTGPHVRQLLRAVSRCA